MASTTSLPVVPVAGGLLKMDTLGRVRTSRERRAAILAEFDQSGVSAAQSAKLAGIRYSTFAAWRQRRRGPKPGQRAAGTPRRPALRLVEAVIDPASAGAAVPAQSLQFQLPGGVRLELATLAQVPLAAALLHALQPPAAC